MPKVAAVFLVMVIAFAASVMFFEKKDNGESFNNLFSSIWYTMVTVTTVGYGDMFPKSVGGRIIGMIAMFFGVGMMGIITGRIASSLVERQLQAGRGLVGMQKLENHFIICGWKKDMPQILSDIMKVNPDLDAENIVLINRQDPSAIDELKANPLFNGIKFIHGDHSDEHIMQRANIKKAHTVLILADTSGGATPLEVDSRTVISALTAETLNKKLYLCAEILDTKFQRHLELGHVDEVILSQDYGRTLIANASSATGIGHVINRLISVDSDTPIRVVPFPPEYIGKPYSDLADFFHDRDNTLTVGLLENTGNLYTRKQEALKEAQKTPDISKLVDNLKIVKELKGNTPLINPPASYIVKKHSRAIIITKREAQA